MDCCPCLAPSKDLGFVSWKPSSIKVESKKFVTGSGRDWSAKGASNFALIKKVERQDSESNSRVRGNRNKLEICTLAPCQFTPDGASNALYPGSRIVPGKFRHVDEESRLSLFFVKEGISVKSLPKLAMCPIQDLPKHS